ncbi:MAG: PspC domain-containing protein [Bacteroidota bacterium]|nr:PspC domain-containing protein [Bacteroidota bacterium]MDE2956955.1 PspC domain-containing protein [Bacteroidota bacterium]
MTSHTRSTDDKWVAGVLGGFAAHYGINPQLLRLIYGGLALFTLFVPLLLIYVAAAVILPTE